MNIYAYASPLSPLAGETPVHQLKRRGSAWPAAALGTALPKKKKKKKKVVVQNKFKTNQCGLHNCID